MNRNKEVFDVERKKLISKYKNQISGIGKLQRVDLFVAFEMMRTNAKVLSGVVAGSEFKGGMGIVDTDTFVNDFKEFETVVKC